jgi:hypothetical protein
MVPGGVGLEWPLGLPLPKRRLSFHILLMTQTDKTIPADPAPATPPAPKSPSQTDHKREIGGPPGPEPTRYGDWEHNGRCTDF